MLKGGTKDQADQGIICADQTRLKHWLTRTEGLVRAGLQHRQKRAPVLSEDGRRQPQAAQTQHAEHKRCRVTQCLKKVGERSHGQANTGWSAID